jgi:hypothetical protein
MSNHPKTYGYFELADGTEHSGIRVTLKTKIQAEKSARANGWDPQRDSNIMGAFAAWHAGKGSGLVDLDWGTFLDNAVDAGLYQEDDEDQGIDPEDPTRPAA